MSRSKEGVVEETYSINEVTKILKVERVTLYRWMNEGKLEFFYVGSRRRFTRAAIEKFQRESTEEMRNREKNETPGLGVSALAMAGTA
jgi:excisionase family DNA binding protein